MLPVTHLRGPRRGRLPMALQLRSLIVGKGGSFGAVDRRGQTERKTEVARGYAAVVRGKSLTNRK